MATSASRRTASTSVAPLTVTPTLAPTWTWRPWRGKGGPHRLEDAPGDPDRDLVAGGLLEQDGELVAAKAGDRVLAPDAGLEPAGHGDQQVVAGRVAELVVDRLEVVQVDEQQGQGCAGLGPAAQGVGHPLPEQGPVGQVGEAVVERLVLQLADHRR
jgi:hypothetical protein